MLALLLGATIACAPPSSQELVGLWESRDVSMGGIGTAIELRADGSLISTITVIVGFTYTFEGGQLTTRGAQDPPDAAPNTFAARIEGDELILIGPTGKEMRKQRVGAPTSGAPPIVGVWKSPWPTNGLAVFERYLADGRLDFRLPMRSSRGCYSLDGGRLALQLEGRDATAHAYTLHEGLLEIQDSAGKKPAFLDRVEGEAWYPVETQSAAP